FSYLYDHHQHLHSFPTRRSSDLKALIITSSSVGSGNVGDKFQNVPVPIMNWENNLQDNYLFVGNDATNHGTTGAAQQFIEIVNRSEEHTSELQSLRHLVCRLLLE